MPLRTIQVLVIEDNDCDFELVSRLLYSQNTAGKLCFTATHVDTLELAVERLSKEHTFDVILLDLSLPDASGLEGLRTIREAAPALPVVVVTGMEDEELARAAIHEGAQDYIVKGELDKMIVRSIPHAIERSQIMTELERAKAAAMAATSAKSMFLANMSHEFRTPLTSIIGFTEAALGMSGQEERTRALHAVFRSAQHLLNLVDDILDLSRIEAGKLEVTPSPFSFPELLRDLEVAMKPRAQAKELTFELVPLSMLPQCLTTDGTRLKQVLFNIVGNAIKFTSEGAITVSVSCNAEAKLLCFTVDDTGVGIPEDQRARLFLPFSQGDASTTRRFGGSGLGLALSRELIDLLGGNLKLVDKDGPGTRVSFTTAMTDEDVATLSKYDPASVNDENHRADEKFPMLSGRVLIVDDGEDNRELLAYLLRNTGLTTASAENGQQAINMALNEEFDLILMDMQMPVMDGYTAIQRLRELGYKRPVIAVTASAMKGAARRCLQAGCNSYVQKPFEQRQFYQTLRNYLSSPKEGPAATTAEGAPSQEEDTSGVAANVGERGLSRTGHPPSEELTQLLEADPTLIDLINRFLDKLPARYAELSLAWDKRDWDQMKMLAHKLVGVGTFAYPEVSKAAHALEVAATKKAVKEAQHCVDVLKELSQQLQQY